MRKEIVTAMTTLLSLFSWCCSKTVPYPKDSPWAQNGITSLEKIEINGVRHSVLIRGCNRANPILLYIHASGIPSMPFAHLEYADTGAITEKHFTVVHYDQRGYGKTYLRGGHKKSDITIEQYIKDAEWLVRYLKKRFNKEKIYLVAESWGSVIGTHLISRHPNWFHAYVGVGQVSNVNAYMNLLYDYCEKRARVKRDEKALKDLETPGRPTADMKARALYKSLENVGKWSQRYQTEETGLSGGAGFFFKSLWNAPEYNFFDFQATLTAYKVTQKKTIKEIMGVDLISEVKTIGIPVYFFMGEHDFWVKPTKAYFTALNAKDKHWILVENAGHMTRGDDPEAFIDLLVNQVAAPDQETTIASPH